MEKQLAWADLMLSKTTHETVLRKIDEFLRASRNIFLERKKLENARLDLDRAKSLFENSEQGNQMRAGENVGGSGVAVSTGIANSARLGVSTVTSLISSPRVSSDDLERIRREYETQLTLFRTLLLNMRDLADDQMGSWKTYLEAVRDFMTCGASKTDELLHSLYTDISDVQYMSTTNVQSETSNSSKHILQYHSSNRVRNLRQIGLEPTNRKFRTLKLN